MRIIDTFHPLQHLFIDFEAHDGGSFRFISLLSTLRL